MHFEEGLGIKVFWVQTIRLTPNLLQLVFTALHTHTNAVLFDHRNKACLTDSFLTPS